MHLYGLLLTAAGVFTMAGAICDWDWFMNSRRARFFVSVFGRNGTRLFYLILGLAITTVALLSALGVIDMSK